MKTDAIKLELIQWLSNIDDEGTLRSILLLKKASQTGDWADDLTAEQRKKIEAGLEDIREGRVISRKKLWQKYGRKV